MNKVRVEYYTKNKKVYQYVPTPAECKEIDALKNRQRKARLAAEKKAREAYVLEHCQGYCPKCFLLKPLTGICPNCD